MKKLNRFLSCLLVFVMLFGVFPWGSMAYAAEGEDASAVVVEEAYSEVEVEEPAQETPEQEDALQAESEANKETAPEASALGDDANIETEDENTAEDVADLADNAEEIDPVETNVTDSSEAEDVPVSEGEEANNGEELPADEAPENEEPVADAAEEPQSDEPEPEIITIETFEVNLLPAAGDSGIKVVDGEYYIEPEYNKEELNTVHYQVKFSTSANTGSASLAPGTVEIRIPAHILPTRNNSDTTPIGEMSWSDSAILPVPQAPATSEITSFNYTYDAATDEYVLTNFEAITGAAQTTFEVAYKIGLPSDIVDLTKSRDYNATITIKTGESNITEQDEADSIIYDTKSTLINEQKRVYSQTDEYPAGWGQKPAEDGDDYFYVVWQLFSEVYGRSTQPYTLSLTGESLTIDGEPIDPSCIVGYRNGGSSESRGMDYFSPTGGFSTKPPVYVVDKPVVNPGHAQHSCFVLTKHKKADRDGGVPYGSTITNTVTHELTENDSGNTSSKSANASFKYDKLVFRKPPGNNSIIKYGGKTYEGRILDLSQSRDAVMAGTAFNTKGTVQQYALTLREGGDPTNIDDYGYKNIHMELIDDLFFLEGDYTQELGPEDYEITHFQLFESMYDYVLNRTGTAYELAYNTDYEAYPEVGVYGLFNGEWIQLYKVSRNTRGQTITKDMSGNIVASGGEVPLPAGCAGVKAVVDSPYAQMELSLYVNLALKPTERVLSLVKGADGSFLDSTKVTDVSTLMCVGPNGEQLSYSKAATKAAERTSERDYELYGTLLDHGTADDTIKNLIPTSSISKRLWSRVNNPEKGQVDLRYRVECRERIVNLSGYSIHDMVDSGYFKPQNEGVFYDLLPPGVEPLPETISVTPYSSVYGDPAFDIATTYSVIPNFRGSGRTMLIVRAEVPDGARNYGGAGATLSGFILLFNAYYSWESKADYGATLRNSVAYETGNDQIANGRPDDGGTIIDQMLLADLDDDGNPEGTPGRYLYASTTDTLTMVTASQAELRKLVRGPENSGYVDGMRDEEVLVSDSDPYSYRLRFGTTEYTEMTDIVVYDSLENYHPAGGGVQWRGIFQNVDASMAQNLGIAPVIYYSTVSELDLSNAANKDLTNAAIWSATPPADLSTVTAVAFDLRKDTSGNDFVLPKNKTLSLYINMVAPEDSAQFRTWVEQEAHAYNNVYLSDTLLASNESGVVSRTPEYIHQDYTKVGLKPLCKLKLTKTVTGAETDEAFTFKITLTDAEGKPLTRMYEYEGIGVPDGRIYSGATIRLADGQSIIIRNLPQGAKYTIEETEYGDFTPTVPNNASGTLDPETMQEVEFVNVYTPTKTYGFKLHKIDYNSEETLQGAVFELKDKDGNTLSFDFDEDTHTYTYDPDGTVTKITAYTNPLTTVKGLTPGTYKLTESNPPLGYARLNDTVTINIEAEKDADEHLTGNAVFSVTGSSYAVIAYETDPTDETECEDRTTVTDDDDTNANGLSVHVEIRNLKGVSMPVTGSNNALLCMLSGFLILTGYGAYTLLAFRRRSRKRL